ncbi:MAG: hypothetical protein WC517_01925 [Patescibacteria group bacterium]
MRKINMERTGGMTTPINEEDLETNKIVEETKTNEGAKYRTKYRIGRNEFGLGEDFDIETFDTAPFKTQLDIRMEEDERNRKREWKRLHPTGGNVHLPDGTFDFENFNYARKITVAEMGLIRETDSDIITNKEQEKGITLEGLLHKIDNISSSEEFAELHSDLDSLLKTEKKNPDTRLVTGDFGRIRNIFNDAIKKRRWQLKRDEK